MNTKMFSYWGFVGVCLAACGCVDLEKPNTVGFLSDYSHLRPETDLRSRYWPPDNRLAQYSQFIVDPVPVYLDDETRTELGHDANVLAELSQYMHNTMVKTLEPRYPATGVAPGPATGRIRVAITDLRKNRPFGVGAVAIEAELLDSETGEQILALREIREGTDGAAEWGHVKRIMDDWAHQFYTALEKQHAREPRQPVYSPPLQGLAGGGE